MTRPKLTDADRRIGDLLRDYRLGAGITQMELAAAIGVTYQQVCKYERGLNRIALSRLPAIAAAIGRRPEDFLLAFDAPPPAQPAVGGKRMAMLYDRFRRCSPAHQKAILELSYRLMQDEAAAELDTHEKAA